MANGVLRNVYTLYQGVLYFQTWCYATRVGLTVIYFTLVRKCGLHCTDFLQTHKSLTALFTYLLYRISIKPENKCGKYIWKFIYIVCGLYCADFYETRNHTIHFCEHFLYLILSKSDENYRIYAQNLIHALK